MALLVKNKPVHTLLTTLVFFFLSWIVHCIALHCIVWAGPGQSWTDGGYGRKKDETMLSQPVDRSFAITYCISHPVGLGVCLALSDLFWFRFIDR